MINARVDLTDKSTWVKCCRGQFVSSIIFQSWQFKNSTTNYFFIKVEVQQQQPFILTRLFFPVYWGQPRLWPSHNILLHLDLSQASSLQSPFFLISSFNTSLHLFLGLPFTPSPSTWSVSILFIQHNSSLLSTWPNHLNLFRRITSPMSLIASSMLLTHSLLFLSLKLTPVIHLNILISLLCILLISSIFVAHVSLPYNIAGLMHVV